MAINITASKPAQQFYAEWETAMDKVLARHPEKEGQYFPVFKQILQDYNGYISGVAANIDPRLPQDKQDRIIAEQSKLFHQQYGQKLPPQAQEAWNAMSYELRKPWWEALLALVYDKDKGAKEGVAAGIKPGGVIGAVAGVLGAKYAFGLQEVSLFSIGVGAVMAVGFAYGGGLLEDKAREQFAPTPTPSAPPPALVALGPAPARAAGAAPSVPPPAPANDIPPPVPTPPGSSPPASKTGGVGK